MTPEKPTTQANPDEQPTPSGVDPNGYGVAVPADAAPHECRYCGRPFAESDYLALHRGLAHDHRLATGERAAYREARERERVALRRFRLKAVGGVVVVYFGLLMGYALL